MGTLDSARNRLEEARKSARSRATRERIGPDWPRADGIEPDDAWEELNYQILQNSLKVSFGGMEGTADIWCRAAFPTYSEHPKAGYVAFMVSDSIEKAACKMAQCTGADPGHGVWKPDRFAQ